MHSLGAYRLDATLLETASRVSSIDELIDQWLSKKGASEPRATDGDFLSKSGDGTGQFSRSLTETSVGAVREIELIETATSGAMFTTLVQIAQTETDVNVFVSLTVTPGASLVTPLKLAPRCPSIVRALIEKHNDWRYAGQIVPIGIPFDATSVQGVKQLCEAIRDRSRRLPIVVVSLDSDEVVWPNLPKEAARQLVGLADVAYVDFESSWQMTDEMGSSNSCYLGAVRLYWPALRGDGIFDGVTWVPSRLTAFGEGDVGRNRFLSVLRSMVMSTAALTMQPPKALRDIKGEVNRQKLATLSAGTDGSNLSLLNELNDKLQSDLDRAQATIGALQWQLAELRSGRNSEEIGGGESESSDVPAHTPPVAGEVRFYKKIGSGGGVDTLVVTKECQHGASWRPAFKAEQAKKGLFKLEGRSDWQSMAHCSQCTGGGRWRVHW